MVLHRVATTPAAAALDFDAIRAELGIPGPFDADALDAAARAAATPPSPSRDATDLDLVTIDPPGSRDLDQAVGIVDRPGGWRVHYAIADVGAWVEPGGALDLATRERTQTYYAPDRNEPLHPPRLGEDAASLLADQDRPAVLWTIDVDDDGTTAGVEVGRALVRSRAQLTYADVQSGLDAGRPPAAVASLPQLGAALLADARRRDAIDLGLPEQEVVADADGRWTIALRADLPVESWNAQISLLTGRAAARIMLDGGRGVLRTLPPPDPRRFPFLRQTAEALGIEWRHDDHPGDVLARLDTSVPRHAAFADLAAELLRGAAYTWLDGTAPEVSSHAGVGAPYAHVTAPLRRLVDRFATATCLALVDGHPLPDWLDAALATLPEVMAEGDRRAHALDHAVVDAAEAMVLAGRIGEEFDAAVIETGPDHGTVVLDALAVRARCDGPDLPLGDRVRVRCTAADIAARQVRFELSGREGAGAYAP